MSDISKYLKQKQKQVKGTYPDGKLNDNDEGALMIAVTHKDDQIVIEFPKPVKWFAMPPNLAKQLAQSILDLAEKIEREKNGK